MTDVGVVLDKDKVRAVIQKLVREEFFPANDPLTIEQATNSIMALQRPPASIEDVALTVLCEYCGYTPGNPCHRAGKIVRSHPSRIQRALKSAS